MKFGSREICDVTFKALDTMKVGKTTFIAGQPVFKIDTAQTSGLEQATTTVYAQGGKGYNRLIAWEGEKTVTFTVTDALMSPMGLHVLTDAGFSTADDDNLSHVHITLQKMIEDGKVKVTLDDLQNETGLDIAESFNVCVSTKVPAFGTLVDNTGYAIGYLGKLDAPTGGTSTFSDCVLVDKSNDAVFTIAEHNDEVVELDFYLVMNSGVTEITVEPNNFGGYFYVEAQTLYRRQDTGKDMAAEVIIPKAKIQSAFTISMAANGDPSTFDFVMDAFPSYTKFNREKQIVFAIQIIGTDEFKAADSSVHTHPKN